jgi:hypothetical protein
MLVTKLRISGDNGLVPAGRYFAQLAENLRANNVRDAAALEKAEAQERRLEMRYRKSAAASVRPRSTIENIACA